MLENALPKVHEQLTAQGFCRVSEITHTYAYDGILKCNELKVPVRFSFSDLSFSSLPDIHLCEPRPDVLCRPLPHVDHHGKVCFLDIESYRLDPYRPAQMVANLLELARRVLVDSITNKNANDVGYEFGSYWEDEGLACFLSDYQKGPVLKYNRIIYISRLNSSEKELLVAGGEQEIESHLIWMKGTLKYSTHRHAVWVNVSASALLPISGVWPPKNCKSFFDWLKLVDLTAFNKLRNAIGTKACAHSPLLIILKTPGVIVGFEIILPKKLKSAEADPSRFRKAVMADNGRFGTKVRRVLVHDISGRYIASRNLTGVGLAGKSIVLVGCGTLGGYLARLLVQTGAGQGGGVLELYDDDVVSPGNLGRHYLDAHYLYENKAEACCHKLQDEYPTVNVKHYDRAFSNLSVARTADIVIDATGQMTMSSSINEQAITSYKNQDRFPAVLYTWIDGNGFCGRTLFYDGSGGCFRCLQLPSGRDRFEPLVSENDLTPMSYKCGESYVPYPPSASVQTAGLALEAVLDWVNGSPTPHFRSRPFHKKARVIKDQHILEPFSECPACQK